MYYGYAQGYEDQQDFAEQDLPSTRAGDAFVISSPPHLNRSQLSLEHLGGRRDAWISHSCISYIGIQEMMFDLALFSEGT